MVHPQEYVELSSCEPFNGHIPIFGLGAVPNLIVPHEGPDQTRFTLTDTILASDRNVGLVTVKQDNATFVSLRNQG